MIGFPAPSRPARRRHSLARRLPQKGSETVFEEAAMRRSIVCMLVVASLAVLLEGLTGSGSACAVQEPPSPAPRFVREAQRTLRELGYHPGPADGVVGPKTKDALARYQRSEGIEVTRRLDPETMARLDIHERLFRPARAARG
jgi:Putative peptidoglycan binding domain